MTDEDDDLDRDIGGSSTTAVADSSISSSKPPPPPPQPLSETVPPRPPKRARLSTADHSGSGSHTTAAASVRAEDEAPPPPPLAVPHGSPAPKTEEPSKRQRGNENSVYKSVAKRVSLEHFANYLPLTVDGKVEVIEVQKTEQLIAKWQFVVERRRTMLNLGPEEVDPKTQLSGEKVKAIMMTWTLDFLKWPPV